MTEKQMSYSEYINTLNEIKAKRKSLFGHICDLFKESYELLKEGTIAVYNIALESYKAKLTGEEANDVVNYHISKGKKQAEKVYKDRKPEEIGKLESKILAELSGLYQEFSKI